MNQVLIDYLERRFIHLLQKHSSIVQGIPTNHLPKTGSRYMAQIYFKPHPLYGSTFLDINESYLSSTVDIKNYNYGWRMKDGSILLPPQERTGPLMAIKYAHISAWGKEDHSHPPFKMNSPYHHHHLPQRRSERLECPHIRSLEAVLDFIHPFLEEESEYKPCENLCVPYFV